MTEKDFDPQWLEKPFDKRLTKENRHKSYRCTYVEAHHYIERLNKAFDYRWSLEVVEHGVVDKMTKSGKGAPFFIALVRLSVPHLGICKEQWGGAQLLGADPEDPRKTAVADGMKKCASLLGIGAGLYGETERVPDGTDNAPSSDQWARLCESAGYTLDEDGKAAFMRYISTFSREKYGVARSRLTAAQIDELIAIHERKGGNVQAG